MEFQDLLQAQGLALAMLDSLFVSKGVLKPGEFSRHLGNLATVTNETDQAVGSVLEAWSGIIGCLH